MEPYRQENGHEARNNLTDHARPSRWLSGSFAHSVSPLDLDPFPDYLLDPQIQADQPQARLKQRPEGNEDARQPQPHVGQYVPYPSYPADGLPYPTQCPMPPSPVSMGAPANRPTPNHLQQTRRGPAIPDGLYAAPAGVRYTAGGALGPMMPSPTFTAPEWPLAPSPTSVPGLGFHGTEAGYMGTPDAYSPWLGADEGPAWPPGRPGSCSASQPPSQARSPVPPAQDTDAWTYTVDVWPAQQPANSDERYIDEHIAAVQKNLAHKGYWEPPFELVPAKPGREACRRYTLPRRYRDDEKARLEFLQVFSANRPYNRALPNYHYSMSVALGYEARPFGLHPDPSYPSIEEAEAAHDTGVPADEHGAFADHAVSELTNFSPPSPHSSLLPPPPSAPADAEHHAINLATSSPPAPDMPLAEAAAAIAAASASAAPLAPAAAAQRTKAVPKPDREVRRTPDGKFLCSWEGCNEAVKTFSRKCEWSKHMDKHDRPYKCSVSGCEKLPGFTYSGGLLRHQREVHKQHGGPRNPLHCPHPSCKRATGKGFSRLENLNEHLRRVHTSGGGGERAGDEPDDAAGAGGPGEGGAGAGEKRKPDDEDLRGEVKKLHTENRELKQQLASQQDKIKTQEQRLIAMQTQMMTLQNYMSQQHAGATLHHQPSGHLANGSPGSAMLGDACDF